MSERDSGFYWVVCSGSEQVAYYSVSSEGWYLNGMLDRLSDSDLYEIDERRLMRNEV